MSYEHVMIDFETLGIDPNCVVLSLGAVKFDETGVDGKDTFHHLFNVQDQLDADRTVTASTISWWMGQSDNARAQFSEQSRIRLGPGLVLDAFNRWWGDAKYIWSHGSNFDTVILDDLMHMWGRHTPWRYSDVRDTRTLFDMFNKTHPSFQEELMVNLKPAGVTAHDALIDSFNQAKAVQYAMFMLKP